MYTKCVDVQWCCTLSVIHVFVVGLQILIVCCETVVIQYTHAIFKAISVLCIATSVYYFNMFEIQCGE